MADVLRFLNQGWGSVNFRAAEIEGSDGLIHYMDSDRWEYSEDDKSRSSIYTGIRQIVIFTSNHRIIAARHSCGCCKSPDVALPAVPDRWNPKLVSAVLSMVHDWLHLLS